MALLCGDFTVDVERRRVCASHGEIRLTPKAFDVLRALIDEAPRALSKAVLMQRVWTETFVNDGSLTTVINELRVALGDDARQPRYIRTVYGFGYAFEAPVRNATGDGSGESAWRLVHADRIVSIPEGSNVVGRAGHAGIVFDVPGVSRQHARLTVVEGEVRLEDLGSKNGTWVGRRRLTTAATVADGDQVRFGPIVVTVRRARASRTTETVAQSI